MNLLGQKAPSSTSFQSRTSLKPVPSTQLLVWRTHHIFHITTTPPPFRIKRNNQISASLGVYFQEAGAAHSNPRRHSKYIHLCLLTRQQKDCSVFLAPPKFRQSLYQSFSWPNREGFGAAVLEQLKPNQLSSSPFVEDAPVSDGSRHVSGGVRTCEPLFRESLTHGCKSHCGKVSTDGRRRETQFFRA